jgi:hypothetical protein
VLKVMQIALKNAKPLKMMQKLQILILPSPDLVQMSHSMQ